MSNLVTTAPGTEIPIDPATLGPAMQALANDMQRRFVLALVQGAKSPSEAALIAGYSSKAAGAGSRLANSPKIQAALLEEAAKSVRVTAVRALRVLDEIAFDKSAHARDRLKAAEMILARGGFAEIARYQVDVVHRTDEQLRHELVAMATELGLTAEESRKLIGSAPVIEAEYAEVVADPPTGIAPERDARGAPIDPEASRTAEDRARDRMYAARTRAETPDERATRQLAERAQKSADMKRKFAEARLTGDAHSFDGLEDLIGPPADDLPSDDAGHDGPLAKEAGGLSDFNPSTPIRSKEHEYRK